MLQVSLIGNVGGDAEIKVADGREFVAFRVAHNESFEGADGNKVERTAWIDCTMNCVNGRPAVLPYLKAGTLVFVQGSASLRVYPSAKDRCWKAGLTIHVSKVELLGGSSDVIPRRLYNAEGAMIDVAKYYYCDLSKTTLTDARGNKYNVDKKGWITPDDVVNDEESQQ